MSNTRPFITVIIPTYNSSATLSRTLDSILEQKNGSFEIWIIDGSSKDETIEILKQYQSRDARVNFVSEPDKGTYDAMNKGIQKATGNWLYFLGSDDELNNPLVFETFAQAARQTDAKVLYGNVQIINDTTWAKDGDIYDGPFDLKKILLKNICHQSILYNKDFVVSAGLQYNLAYKLLADWDFNLQCFARTEFYHLNFTVANFYSGGQTTAQNKDLPFEEDFFDNLVRYFNLNPFDKKIAELPEYLLPQVYSLQKKQSALRYYYRKIKRKILAA